MSNQYKVLATMDEYAYIQCLNCECKFECDPHTEENLVFDISTKVLLPKCPGCKIIFGVNDTIEGELK